MRKWILTVHISSFHAETKHLSTGKILTRLFAVCKYVRLIFQRQNNSKFSEQLCEDEWGIQACVRLANVFVAIKRTKHIRTSLTKERVHNTK